MANEYNRNIVEKYIFHKLSKQGYMWEFEDTAAIGENGEEVGRNNGSINAPPPTLMRRYRGGGGGGDEEDDDGGDTDTDTGPGENIPRLSGTGFARYADATHRVLREAGDELERLYRSDLTEMSRQLYLTSSTAQRRFGEVMDELFRDGVNWGRIIAFFEFGGTVCVECAGKEEMTSQVDRIAEWMTEYLNGPLSSWIQDNGGWGQQLVCVCVVGRTCRAVQCSAKAGEEDAATLPSLAH
ncbi:hypothetical protein NHX12_004101 [Muraenolepis orangiensis]|uniref:Apoptosis regulator Bcl-2 family BH4 domain-containing protein n=1 Tax=Muraenolepis orangiensis TaxID=630683 RepID=A0A9Q0DTT6_9TELE|nr:hypothetical protein NHX12_004101 [Muraenolepis orangiensis]